MRLFLITFLLLKIFSPAYANTIYYLTKIPNLQVYDLTASNGIKYLKAEKSFKVGIVKNNVQCNKPSENNIKNKFNLIKSNLEKYEKNFLEKIKNITIKKNKLFDQRVKQLNDRFEKEISDEIVKNVIHVTEKRIKNNLDQKKNNSIIKTSIENIKFKIDL